jgi:hypothetical protein
MTIQHVFLGENCKSQFGGSKRRRHLDVVARDEELPCTLFVYLQNAIVIQFERNRDNHCRSDIDLVVRSTESLPDMSCQNLCTLSLFP